MYDHEIRTGKNAKQIVLRASQFAKSEPQGPSYLIASRECLEEKIEPYQVDARKWKPVAPSALAPASVEEIGTALLAAKTPVVITTYLGRDKEAVTELVKLCESAGLAVLVRSSEISGSQTLTHYLGSTSGLHEFPTRP